jgi:hypothetical protein
MKRISLLLILALVPSHCWASFVQVCPDLAGCAESEMVWLQIDPFGAHLNPSLVGLVVGGGLLLWGTGCGVGMYLQSLRKMR